METVKYWKSADAVQAKLTEYDPSQKGVLIMKMEGEKYIFPGFPRGYLLFGKLSKLKHEIKNQIFNDSWADLENEAYEDEIRKRIESESIPNIFKLFEEHKIDLMPPSKMVEPVRELHRAWTKVATAKSSLIWRDMITHIFQEDDSYRFRFQWMVPFMGSIRVKINPIKRFEKGLEYMEHAEMIGDMKERVRLFKRIMLMLLRDEENKDFFTRLFKEINWRKVAMSKADKYFFRGKYFKVDYDKFDY